MNKLLIAGLLVLLPFSSKKYVITHYNITFAADLSNRVNASLYRRPLDDAQILGLLTSNLYPSILRSHRSENQKDKLRIDFINKGLINQYKVNTDKLTIDFGRFPNQNARIDYIKERNNVKQTLRKDLTSLVSEFQRVNKAAEHQNFGADIWTYLNEGMDNAAVLPDEKSIADENNTYTNSYRNVLILTTDGYIEAGIYDKGFDLSKKTVDRFRDAYLASGEAEMANFFKKNKQYRIKPVQNDNLKNLEILVLELYDRSRSKVGAATVHPTDLEIIKLFWSNWLKESKVRRFELRPMANSKNEAEKIILDFLNVEKKTEQ
ncbi:hypothetical protein [Mucilaginibacter sp. FT3.2]|uniref:hypothetical protein n=1 Tax=Mucilaginibacter sp. FT3.2 TaxID=2723090 RepID=UPI001607D72D|nr:hypothetical protein [Mucilaginibacter sp. FT3.2]MBB6233026.1 hypothetical protein [Mucilaginibacter sp. FT3.2]